MVSVAGVMRKDMERVFPQARCEVIHNGMNLAQAPKESRGERRETRDERRETRDERRETRDERRETRDERRETGPIRFFVFEVGFLLLFWFGILRARERLQVPPKPRGYGGAKPPFQSRQAHFVNLSPNWIANCRTAAFQVTSLSESLCLGQKLKGQEND